MEEARFEIKEGLSVANFLHIHTVDARLTHLQNTCAWASANPSVGTIRRRALSITMLMSIAPALALVVVLND